MNPSFLIVVAQKSMNADPASGSCRWLWLTRCTPTAAVARCGSTSLALLPTAAVCCIDRLNAPPGPVIRRRAKKSGARTVTIGEAQLARPRPSQASTLAGIEVLTLPSGAPACTW